MRIWLARVFIGFAFSLLLAHSLISHHHDEQVIELKADHHHHEDDHSATPFDNVKLDGDFVQKLDSPYSDICVPVNLVVLEYSFMLEPVTLVQQFSIPPPEYPLTLFNIDTSSLRGPPVYC